MNFRHNIHGDIQLQSSICRIPPLPFFDFYSTQHADAESYTQCKANNNRWVEWRCRQAVDQLLNGNSMFVQQITIYDR